jgi:uncharacterized protein YegP (UPF0339 family)
MPGKFVMKKSGKGFHWNLLASNGKVIATSEHYETRRAALAGIAFVQKNAPGAATVDADRRPACYQEDGQAQRAQGHSEEERLTVRQHTDGPPSGTRVVGRPSYGSGQPRTCYSSRSGGRRRIHPGRFPDKFGSAQCISRA